MVCVHVHMSPFYCNCVCLTLKISLSWQYDVTFSLVSIYYWHEIVHSIYLFIVLFVIPFNCCLFRPSPSKRLIGYSIVALWPVPLITIWFQ